MKSMITAVFLAILASRIQAETITFGTGIGEFEMEFVTIVEPGNSSDTRIDPPMGAVDYEYRIGKFEVSCQMLISAQADGILENSGGDLICGPRAAFPERLTSLEAMQYVNWLNEQTGHPPAYNMNDRTEVTSVRLRVEPWGPEHPGHNPDNVWRNSRAKFFVPTPDEWHKAAYYDPVEGVYRLYATGDEEPDLVPPAGGTSPNTANFFPNISYVPVDMAGGLSAFGTMGQGGNVSEWEELDYEPDMPRGIQVRNGVEDGDIRQHTAINSRRFSPGSLEGLRIAAVNPVPEPSSFTLLALALFFLGACRRAVHVRSQPSC